MNLHQIVLTGKTLTVPYVAYSRRAGRVHLFQVPVVTVAVDTYIARARDRLDITNDEWEEIYRRSWVLRSIDMQFQYIAPYRFAPSAIGGYTKRLCDTAQNVEVWQNQWVYDTTLVNLIGGQTIRGYCRACFSQSEKLMEYQNVTRINGRFKYSNNYNATYSPDELLLSLRGAKTATEEQIERDILAILTRIRHQA